MKKTRIIKAELKDLDDLCLIENETFDDKRYPLMSRNNFQYHLRKGSNDILIAKQDGVSCGMSVIFYRKNSYFARLYSIAVLPEYQGGEVGKKLFEATMLNARQRKLKGLVLEIRSDNQKHEIRYLNQGFQLVKILPNYYNDSCDGLKLKKVFHA